MISVTKKFSFCYGHFLPEYEGKCQRGHGHNSEVEVEIFRSSGEPSYPTMVTDFGELKAIVAPILEMIDHQTLNALPPWETEPPTAESITKWLAAEISLALPVGVFLARLRVSETPDSWAEWKQC